MINGPKFEISAASMKFHHRKIKKKEKNHVWKLTAEQSKGLWGQDLRLHSILGDREQWKCVLRGKKEFLRPPASLCPVAAGGAADPAQPSATCISPQEQQFSLRPPTLKPKPVKATFNCSGSRQWCKLPVTQAAWAEGLLWLAAPPALSGKFRVALNAVCWWWAELVDWISLGNFHLSASTTSSFDDRKSRLDSNREKLLDFIRACLLHLLYSACALLLPLWLEKEEITILCPSLLQDIQSVSPVDSPSSSPLLCTHHSSDGTVFSISFIVISFIN